MWEPARDPLEISENPVALLIMQAAQGGTEELAVIHRKNLERNLKPEAAQVFLERFQPCCRARIGPSDAPESGGRFA
jgi:hypothetical protein